MTNQTPLNHQLPEAKDIEMKILSSMIQMPETYIDIALSHNLEPEDFYAHGKLYKLLLDMHKSTSPIDLHILTQKLRDRDELDNVGGVAVLTDIATCEYVHTNFVPYLEMVKDKAMLRHVILQSDNLKETALTRQDTPDVLIDELTTLTEQVKNKHFRKEVFIQAEAAVQKMWDMLYDTTEGDETERGINMNMPLLDNVCKFRRGKLIVVCGETSGGKSVLLLQFFLQALMQQLHGVLFSLEMPVDEVMQRLVVNKSGVSATRLDNIKTLTKGEIQELRTASHQLRTAKLDVCDDFGMTIDGIRAHAKLLNRSRKIDFLAVDYLQRMRGGRIKGMTREQELADYASSLKNLAKELECPVFTASQLNDDGKLRESRAIGHEADIVIKITDKGLRIDKNRGGKKDVSVKYFLNGPLQRFDNQYCA